MDFRHTFVSVGYVRDMYIQKISFINVDKGICMFARVKLLWPMVMGTRTAAREILAYQCY